VYAKPKSTRRKKSTAADDSEFFLAWWLETEGQLPHPEEAQTGRQAEGTLKLCRLLVRAGDGIFVPCDCVGPCPLEGR